MPSLIGNKPNQVPSNGDLGTLAFQDASNVSVGSVTYSGNLNFTGTGNRITGDFSNATLANRVAFQSSTTNGNTTLSAIPNGTGTQSRLNLFNTTDTSNYSVSSLLIGTGEVRLISDAAGTGTQLPISVYTGGSERLRIDTNGNVGVGTSSPGYRLDVRASSAAVNIQSTTSTSISYINFLNSGYNYIGAEGSTGGTLFSGTAPYSAVFGTVSPYPVAFATNGTERMRITSAGGVSFGSSGTAYGTAGQVLTSNGDAAPTWGSAVFRATSVASTSGTAIDFTGIPSWVRKITVLLTGVSLSAAGTVVIQIGDSGGIETTGYVSNAVTIDSAGGLAHVASTTAFTLRDASAAGTIDAHVTISNISGNTWIASGTLNTTIANAETGCASGRKTLSDVLTQVRITRTAGNFDAGTVNIMYE